MEPPKSQKFYQSMLNALHGLKDDFDANDVPEEAKGLLGHILEICLEDYRDRFQT